MFAFSEGFLIAAVAVFALVIARRYTRLPARIALNVTFSGVPRGAWPRPFIWLPLPVLVAIAVLLPALPHPEVNDAQLAVVELGIGIITLAIALLFNELIDVALGARQRISLGARGAIGFAIVANLAGNVIAGSRLG